MPKDYKAMSLAYQPCNRPLWTEPKKKKKHRGKERPSPRLVKFANKMREKMTPSEAMLDVVLTETLPIHGLKHTSQHVIGHRITDFAIPQHHLAIEVDGEYHFFHGRKDGFRTMQMKKRGWRVIRFTNHAVETDILGVLKEILAACGSQYELAE